VAGREQLLLLDQLENELGDAIVPRQTARAVNGEQLAERFEEPRPIVEPADAHGAGEHAHADLAALEHRFGRRVSCRACEELAQCLALRANLAGKQGAAVERQRDSFS
jgi:hypothetical protein